MQVGETAVDQRAHEVQRQRRALVTAQHQLGIGLAVGGRERRPVDDVAAVARQREPSFVSKSALRGFAYWPAIRPTG